MKYIIHNKNKYPISKIMKKNFKIITKEITNYLNIEKEYVFDVSFVSKYSIKKINLNYRSKNKVTDVISFSFLNQKFYGNLLGEIFICYDKCISQAKIYKKTLNREISFMFLHGLLHLLGYDHINEIDSNKMFQIQSLVLEKTYE